MDNLTKVDRIFNQLPKFLNARSNTNWNALVQAIGQSDENLSQLLAQVKQQFFISTASRPYIDVLAANSNIQRPQLVGMSDAAFSKYIPILSYQPKQVKHIIDLLLNVFFAPQSTTAFITSGAYEPYALQDTWGLNLTIDGIYSENITFSASTFTDITNALASEVVAAYNSQAQYSYAVVDYDSTTKHNYVQIFSNTIGSKGSIQIAGGLSLIALQFNGFLTTAGNGSNTQWTVSKVGQTVTYTWTGGANPNIQLLQVGDLLLSNLPGNQGSFPITSINLSNDSIVFTNLFATPGVYTQVSANDTKFLAVDKYSPYKVINRAITWETVQGEVTIEMPATPPVVERSLMGGMHINGATTFMTDVNDSTTITVDDASGFPLSGNFIIQPVEAITSHIISPDENDVITNTMNGRVIYPFQKYNYASRLVLSTFGSITSGSNQLTVNSVAGLEAGMTIFMTGLPARATISTIIGNVITTTELATATSTNVAVNFGGNTFTGITPNLPTLSSLDEVTISSISRTNGVVTVDTSTATDFAVGDTVIISGCSGINVLTTTGDINSTNVISNLASENQLAIGQLVFGTNIPANTTVTQILSDTSVEVNNVIPATATGITVMFNETLNGAYAIQSVISSTEFTYDALGTDGTATTVGTAGTESVGLANANSTIILTDAQNASDTGIIGPYVWDTNAAYVLSSNIAQIEDEIAVGEIVQLLDISANNTIPNQTGFLIFDYGLNTQEGPVTYLYKPSDNIIALDPSYIFQQNHAIGSSVVMLSHKGPHVMSGTAAEYPPYVTDPTQVRETLESLIESVASAGIFVNFLIRYPQQLYGTLDVYDV